VVVLDNTVLLKTPRRYPQEAGGWSLSAAADFSSTVDFLRKQAKCPPDTAEHMGVLLGAVIAYARPFTDSATQAFNQSPDRMECFMGIAADLGANPGVHSSILLAREELLFLSDSWGASCRASASLRRMRRFAYPNPSCARIMSRIDLGDFKRAAILMRLACVFFLAELMPVGRI
jgi:hypothetical protein